MHSPKIVERGFALGVFAIGAIFLGAPLSASAGDEPSLDTTIKLINGMVAHGALAQARADTMIKDAQRQAAVAEALKSTLGKLPGENATPIAAAAEGSSNLMREQIKRELLAEMKAQLADDIKRQVLAELTGAAATSLPASALQASSGAAEPAAGSASGATADTAKPRVVRVPYVPETMRREIREQLKREVLTQAREERWGNPDVLPEWLGRFHFEGDVRLRYDSFKLSKDNSSAGVANYVSGTGLTRAADMVGSNGNFSGVPNVNTQEDYTRTRLRFRFGATAKVSDTVSAGLRISTGNTSGPTSTNQTLGQGLNKYALVLDRGFVTFNPSPVLTLTGGRIANPFFSTDLVWADDLNFEGIAANYTHTHTPILKSSLTAGWFPLRTENPLQTTARDLKGLQAGLTWRFAPSSDIRLGAAIYNYRGIEGQLETDTRYGPPSASDYATRYEYPNGLRQRGNTMFVVNALADPLAGTTYWGLASDFREFNLTGSMDIAKFDPVHVVLTGDYVKNMGFDREKMAVRSGSAIIDAKNYGYLGRLTVGYPAMSRWGDWNVSLAYRWLGSDAVLDAFTNSDFGMGGTNNKGYILGGNFGIDKNAWVSVRWMASQLISSMAPKVAASTAAPTKLSVDLLQIDLNAKF